MSEEAKSKASGIFVLVERLVRIATNRVSGRERTSALDPKLTESLVSNWSALGREESLQTKLQTNHAAQHGIGYHAPGSSEQKW
jgi:hypothetical protein